MSDLQHPCEHWAEPISLAAAGCLSPDEERDVRRHIETCSDCRERFRQLTELCGVLAEAQFTADSAEAAIIERVMSAVTSDESGQPIVRTRAEMIHPTLLNRSLDTWRWIMRSPVSRVSAAAVFVLAVIGAALLFHGGGTRHVFADFVAPILEAKSAKFKITSEMKGPPAVTTTGEVMVFDATRSRQEMEMVMQMPTRSKTQKPNKSKMVMIFDWGRGKSLTLDPATKTAMVVSVANLTKDQVEQQDMFAWFRSILADARDKPDVKREPLGEKDIDGRRVVGFRVTSKGMVVSLWGDPKTGLPVLAEATMAMFPDARTTMSDFVFNVNLDESLFSVEPPPGYTVRNMEIDASTPEEKDLIETFRIYSELSGGALPDSLDLRKILETAGKMVGIKSGMQVARERLASGKKKLNEEQMRKLEELVRKMMDLQFAPGKEKPNEAEMRKVEEQLHKIVDGEKLAPGKGKPNKEETRKIKQADMRKIMEASTKKLIEVQIPLQRGLLFAFGLPTEADAHYAGKGVSLGAADTPIFWYRPKDSQKYRVIYADLSVRDADTPPDVPNAQPVPAPSSPKK